MSKVTVSVVIPCYNHSQYVERSIISVLSQKGHFDLELIVVDDCSTDTTIDVVHDLLKTYSFKFLTNENNVGVSKTLERGIKCSTGGFICFLASDDFYLDDKLAVQVDMMLSEGYDCLYAKGTIYSSGEEKVIDQNLDFFDNRLSAGGYSAYEAMAVDDTNGPLLQSAIMKKEVAYSLVGLQNSFRSDDWVILLHILKNYRVGFLNKSVFGYRLHDSNAHKNYWKMFALRIEVVSGYIAVRDEYLFTKAFSNLLISHSGALARDKKYSLAFRFAIASLAFGFPLAKMLRVLKRKLRIANV